MANADTLPLWLDSVQAVILAGGKGTRMFPSTKPKCLTEIKGKPILLQQLRWLRTSGVRHITVCIGNNANEVATALAGFANELRDIQISMSNAGTEAGIGERLQCALALLPRNSLSLVCYGDTLADIAIESMVKIQRQDPECSVVAVCRYQLPLGIFVLHEDHRIVQQFHEKPYTEELVPHAYANIGYLLSPTSSLYQSAHNWPDVLQSLISKNQLLSHIHLGRHITINTPADVEQAEKEWTV